MPKSPAPPAPPKAHPAGPPPVKAPAKGPAPPAPKPAPPPPLNTPAPAAVPVPPPAGHHATRQTCVIALNPSFPACAPAVAQLGANAPFNTACLTVAAKGIAPFLALCGRCAAQFGVADPAKDVAAGTVTGNTGAIGSGMGCIGSAGGFGGSSGGFGGSAGGPHA